MHIEDLIAEEKNGVTKLSLGRVAFWMVFMVVLGRIVATGVIDSTVLGLIALLLTYGGFKKTKMAGDNVLGHDRGNPLNIEKENRNSGHGENQ